MERYFSGTSNLVLPVKNKTFFPPEFREKTRLTYYSSLFNSLEVNASFYRMPICRTLIKWSGEVPSDFAFSFKLIKDVTHAEKGKFRLECVQRFMQVLQSTPNRGCLLIQLPPKFRRDIPGLSALLAELSAFGWPVAVEFRNREWYDDKVFSMLSAFDCALVLHDMKKCASPMETTSSKYVYLRFHGPEGNYRGTYDDNFLYEYAQYIKDWISEGKIIFSYFNNTLGAAAQNLQTLDRFVNGRY